MIARNEEDVLRSWDEWEVPLVTVCCTTYNHAPYIAQALDGFLMQKTDFPFEILVRDDCSTDGTNEIVRLYAEKFPKIIQPIFEKENQYSKGVTPMPQVFKQAKGQYLALCEGDDYWVNPEKLQKQIECMIHRPEVDLSFHPAYEEIDGCLSGKFLGNHSTSKVHFSANEFIRNVRSLFCPTASMILRRDVMVPVPEFFDRVPVGDHFMQYLGALRGGVFFLPKPMSVYRREIAGSWTTLMKEKRQASVESLIKSEEELAYTYIKSLEDVREFAGNRFEAEFNQKISKKYSRLAMLYLDNGLLVEFEKAISSCFAYATKPETKTRLIYYFRKVSILMKLLRIYRRFRIAHA